MEIYYCVYLAILIIPFLFRKLYYDEVIKNRKVAIWITSIIIFILALRHPTMGRDLGYDSPYGYLASFQHLAELTWKDIWGMSSYLNYEKGYILYNKLISYISNDYQCLLIVTAIISIAAVGWFIYKYSKNQRLSWIIYLGLPCFLITFSGLRQAIAIGICCIAFYYVEQKKIIKFIVTVVIASSFHYTAFLILPVYPIFWLKIERKKRFLATGIPMILFIFKVPLFFVLSRIVKEGGRTVVENGAFTLFFVFLMIYCFCVAIVDNEDKISTGMLNMFFLACCCQAFGGVYMTAMRLGYFFMVPIIVALPNAIENIERDETRQLVKLAIGVIFIFYGLYAIKTTSWSEANPYHFFWSNL